MSDPNAKKLKAAKRHLRAMMLIKQGLQLAQWGIVQFEEDTEIYLIGKKEMCIYLKELINETLRQETAGPRATGSLELGASSKDDSEGSHAKEALQEEGVSKDRVKSAPEGPFDFARDGEKA